MYDLNCYCNYNRCLASIVNISKLVWIIHLKNGFNWLITRNHCEYKSSVFLFGDKGSKYYKRIFFYHDKLSKY